jgi:hypothetical protein
MRAPTRAVAIAMTSAALLVGANVAAPAASAEVNYSPLYWQLLDRYASVEITTAPIRGVYPTVPECALAQQQGEPIACGDMIVIMNPDGTLGAGWVEDASAPDGWRQVSWSDCDNVGWEDVDDPIYWLCFGW